jgi:hypothetical protein
MKVIAFFSRLTIICNIAFLLFVFLARMEAQQPVTQKTDTVVAVSYFKNIIITLGLAAIIFNLIMCIVYAVLIIIGKQRLLPKWLAMINVLFLIFQLIYFFFR